MIFSQQLADVLCHDRLIQDPILFHVSFYEESSWFSQQDMNHRHVKKVFSCSNVGALDPISKENVWHDQKIDVRTMCRDNYYGPSFFLIMISEFGDGVFIDNYFLIYCPEDFVQKPSEASDWLHWILGKHLLTHLICNFIEVGFHVLIGHWRLL